MRILHVASECYPLIKTGGLADVVAALPPAQALLGADARLLLPGYPAVLDGLADARRIRHLPDPWTGGTARLVHGTTPAGVACYAVEAPELFGRPGNPYVDPFGRDWPDNHRRFALLGWVAAWLAGPGGGPRWRPDIVHGHDWQAGLAPAYLAHAGGPRPAAVTTIHNIAYQGVFPAGLFDELHLPPAAFAIDGVEYYGGVGFLKSGLWHADRITTVSPSYAAEIRSPGGGMGLEGLLAARSSDLLGILNGVDYAVWDPSGDPLLPARYDADDLSGKAKCKAALQAELGLDVAPEPPLFAVVTRLTEQKGFDLLLEAAPMLLGRGGQLAVLGSGEPWLEDGFRSLAARFPGRAATVIGYDEALSHRMQGGADLIVLPSRSEPCGLVQMFGLRYGTLPLVRRVGGLADTVVDADEAALRSGRATGFTFDDAAPEALSRAIERALALFRRPGDWRAVQRHAMSRDFSWAASATSYLDLYRTLYLEV
ncbi:glycogen synthase GlgA [Arenibaculum sp.]|jgi:starch synthase|uniref:glycogen synthase GlgA n=1 Tax=Arenibaculum sp. TaxID=2865862 RepID=UPI002E132B09|nr:glycogen synthase GlgA [Arenibaculum sp.]